MVGGRGGDRDPGESPGAVAPAAGQNDQPRIELGVVVAPGLAEDVIAGIAENLLADLQERFGSVAWRTHLVVDRLVIPPVPTSELLAAARQALLEGDWDLGVVVTDLPLRVGGRSFSRQVSRTHGIGIVSLPALGPLHLRRRLRGALLELVGELVGNGNDHCGERTRRWQRDLLRELGTDIDARPETSLVSLSPPSCSVMCDCFSAWCGRTGRGSSPLDCTARSWQRSR